MGRRTKRWPIWKIAACAVGCGLLCPVLFWLSTLVEAGVGAETRDPLSPAPVLTLSSLIVMAAVASAIANSMSVSFICCGHVLSSRTITTYERACVQYRDTWANASLAARRNTL